MNSYPNKTHVGVVGFRGYSGAELVRILRQHPAVEVYELEHRADAQSGAAPLNGKAARTLHYSLESLQNASIKIVFLATPPEVSLELTPALLDRRIRVIDLSGAFRLQTPENYSEWYKAEHTAPELLAEAAYGLPEFYRDKIAGARLVSNPGCYPTAANLALRPLIQKGLLDRSAGIICDAKSGTTGAGRKASLKTSFSEVDENFSVYGAFTHRHTPEVLQNSGLALEEFTFTAQLLPVNRGILETIHVRLRSGVTGEDVLNAYRDSYAEEPFVRFYAPGVAPDLRSVQYTNFCDIGILPDPHTSRAIIVTTIDNLGKGAASQAVQNMNLLLGLPETDGLL